MKKNIEMKSIVVIGCSRFGATVACSNCRLGHYSSIIDINPKAFRKLDSDYSGYIIEGNAMDPDILAQSNIKNATEVDIVTNDDNTNIYLASMVLAYYKAPLIIVRLQDEKKAELLGDSRIKIISPALLSINSYYNLVNNSSDVNKLVDEKDIMKIKVESNKKGQSK